MKNKRSIRLSPLKKLHVFFGLIMITSLAQSCRTVKESAYFKTITRDTTIQGFVNKNLESKIQKRDILAITVSSLNRELDEQFNGAASAVAGNADQVQQPEGYLVDENGKIKIHHLGLVQAAGLSRRELQDSLQRQLLPYMKEPLITVKFLNHKVTVIGAVVRPGVLAMSNEGMPLLDVLALSGDMVEEANRADVMIIRQKDSVKQVKHLNLEDHSIFTSEWYHLQANDIVYVPPFKDKIKADEQKRNLQATISLIASGISLLVIIINTLTK